MSLLKRIVILNNEEESLKKGALTLIKADNLVKCNLKTQNLQQDCSYIISLLIDDKKLTDFYVEPFKISEFCFSLNYNLDILGEISVLVVKEDDVSVQMFGSTLQNGFSAQELFSKSNINNKAKVSQVCQSENKDETTHEESKNQSDPSFFEVVKQQVEEMFNTYPEFLELEALVDNSKWIKVEYSGMQGYYALGIIYETEKPRYIGYAIPSSKEVPPPKHLEEYCQFLPSENENGFYLMLQDAQNGNSVVMWNALHFTFFWKLIANIYI